MVLRVGAHIAAAGGDHHTWRRQRGLTPCARVTKGRERERGRRRPPTVTMSIDDDECRIASRRVSREGKAMTKGYFQWG
jgi:hypothetical protein